MYEYKFVDYHYPIYMSSNILVAMTTKMTAQEVSCVLPTDYRHDKWFLLLSGWRGLCNLHDQNLMERGYFSFKNEDWETSANDESLSTMLMSSHGQNTR